MTQHTQHFTPIEHCDLGDLVAENDQELKERYVLNPHYEQADRFDSKRVYFIGKKGFGKSALLQMLRLSKPKDHLVDLGHVDIGLDLLKLEHALKQFPRTAQSVLFQYFWKAVLMLHVHEAIGVKWGRLSKTRPQKALDIVRAALGEPGGGSGFAGMLKSMLGKVALSFEGTKLKVGLQAGIRDPAFVQDLIKQTHFHDIQLASTNFEHLIREEEVYILIDDLDRGWSNDPLQNAYVAALFEGIQKLNRLPNLRFVVSLRLDIFKNLALENPDKLVQNVQRLSWRRDTLRRIVEQRLRAVLDEPPGRTRKRFDLKKKSGNPIENILLHCFPHPRDAIWTFQSIFDLAEEQQTGVITQSLVDEAMRKASSSRVEWICSEWRHVYPWLADALAKFKDCQHVYAVEDFESLLKGGTGGCGDPQDVIHALLATGIVGLKHRVDRDAVFYFAEDPPGPNYERTSYLEVHSAVCDALRSGQWHPS